MHKPSPSAAFLNPRPASQTHLQTDTLTEHLSSFPQTQAKCSSLRSQFPVLISGKPSLLHTLLEAPSEEVPRVPTPSPLSSQQTRTDFSWDGINVSAAPPRPLQSPLTPLPCPLPSAAIEHSAPFLQRALGALTFFTYPQTFKGGWGIGLLGTPGYNGSLTTHPSSYPSSWKPWTVLHI